MENLNPVVQYFDESGLFLLTTFNTAYAFQRLDDGGLLHIYWGAKFPLLSDYPALRSNYQHSSAHAYHHELLAEYPTLGGMQEVEPGLRTRMEDGTRDLRLVFQDYEIGPQGDELAIRLKDEFYGLLLTLRYQVFADCDIVTRRIEVANTGTTDITLEEALSGSLLLPTERAGQFRLSHLAGAWASETRLERTLITPGRQVLESRQNMTSHLANPWWAIDLVGPGDQGATETHGEIWFGVLAWSGNWKTVVEQVRSPQPFTRVAAGLNDWDWAWHLAPGESFETPWLATGYTAAGWGQLSRNLHRYELRHVLPTAFADQLRPVLYNSWEAVTFGVNETQQMELAERAARLGAEYFVVDDGWFGDRDHDRAGLGDWQTNPVKFPNGLGPLIAKVNELGMEFGLWVEPEMVNPDSDLYRTHPDWVYHFPHREPTLSRHQLMLNLARPDVQTWLFETLNGLLTDHNIRYIKWDYNRPISEPGWPDAPLARQREIWVRHVQALYDIVDRLRHNHPQVLFEACASGGGRADLGALSHFDHVWTSDNTDPFDRLTIQQGYSLVYAPKTMYCWVTNWDRHDSHYSLRYRFHSSFMGSLGVGSDIAEWNDEQLTEAAALVARYKEVRPLIQQGQFYRLNGLTDPDQQAVEYLASDGGSGLVLAFYHRHHFWEGQPRLPLQGLEPTDLYELSGDLASDEPTRLSGAALMSRGILPRFAGTLDSALITFRRVGG